jgi:hypothetical protein
MLLGWNRARRAPQRTVDPVVDQEHTVVLEEPVAEVVLRCDMRAGRILRIPSSMSEETVASLFASTMTSVSPTAITRSASAPWRSQEGWLFQDAILEPNVWRLSHDARRQQQPLVG